MTVKFSLTNANVCILDDVTHSSPASKPCDHHALEPSCISGNRKTGKCP